MAIHNIKIIPNSQKERWFYDILSKVGVKPQSVICRTAEFSGTKYDEYIFSEGLYKQIESYLNTET